MNSFNHIIDLWLLFFIIVFLTWLEFFFPANSEFCRFLLISCSIIVFGVGSSLFAGFSNKDNATFVWRVNLFISFFNEWCHCRFAQWFHRSQLGCNKVFYLKKSNLMKKANKCIEVKDLKLSTRLPFNVQG